MEAARLLDSAFAGHPTALLYFVMVMCPLFMNLAQVQLHLPVVSGDQCFICLFLQVLETGSMALQLLLSDMMLKISVVV